MSGKERVNADDIELKEGKEYTVLFISAREPVS